MSATRERKDADRAAPDLDGVADELYALPVEGFTKARDARAKEAAPALARAIRSLRKPSTAAWAVNALVRDRRAQLDEVLSLGASLRTAQRDLDGAELKKLTAQRRRLVRALARQAADLAERAGRTIGGAAVAEVEQTLQAALADAAAAEAVRTGRLVRTLESVGFDEVDLAGAVGGGAPGASGSEDADRTAARERERREAREAADAADREVEETAATLDAVEHRAAATARARMKLAARVERLSEQLEEARNELTDAEKQVAGVERDRSRAERAAAAAEREAARLRARAESLR